MWQGTTARARGGRTIALACPGRVKQALLRERSVDPGPRSQALKPRESNTVPGRTGSRLSLALGRETQARVSRASAASALARAQRRPGTQGTDQGTRQSNKRAMSHWVPALAGAR